ATPKKHQKLFLNFTFFFPPQKQHCLFLYLSVSHIARFSTDGLLPQIQTWAQGHLPHRSLHYALPPHGQKCLSLLPPDLIFSLFHCARPLLHIFSERFFHSPLRTLLLALQIGNRLIQNHTLHSTGIIHD